MVEGFCDADWASQKHRHSISGFSFHFGIGAISWSSKKARSHIAVEYRGGICHAEACSQGGDLAEEFYERDLRRRKTAHHLMRQSRSHRAGKGQ